MTKEEFIIFFAEQLEIADRSNLNEDTELESLDEWDSYAVMAIMSFADDEFNVNITADDFKEIKTIKDVMTKVGLK